MKHEWSKMSSRDRDKLIAEKVMKLKDVRYQELGYKLFIIYGTIANLVPSYSTSISAAWLIVEKLISEGFTINIRNIHDNRFDVQISTHEKMYDNRLGDAICSTAPEAICEAAMLAMGNELE